MPSLNHNANVAAILNSVGARLTIVTRPIPTPGPDELVVRNHAIAANPVDWKMQDWGFAVKSYPVILGSDVCGVVIAVGAAVTKFKVGDRITGFASAIDTLDHGAWQTYTLLNEIMTTRIPDAVGWAEGSVFPGAFAASVVGLFGILGIPKPDEKKQKGGSGLLIWGASSSVGTAAVQLAKAAGLKIYVTASPNNHEYVKSLGATEVFDHHDVDVVQQIIEAAKSAGVHLTLGYDSISTGETLKKTAEVLSKFGKGKLVTTLPWPEEESEPEGIEVAMTSSYSLKTDRQDLGEWFFNHYLQRSLVDGSIVSSPTAQIVDGGIYSAQKAFDIMKAGVSGRKIVVLLEQQ